MLTSAGNCTTSVVARTGIRLDPEVAAEERDALAHALEAEPVLSRPRGVEPAPVVLDHGRHRAGRPGQHDADRVRLGVLGDVRQRLLDDAVERGLDLGGSRPTPRRLEVDRDARLLGEALREPLERGDEPEVVERFRPQLDGQPANVLERRDDTFAQVGDRLRARRRP